jgi:hypothetical protein
MARRLFSEWFRSEGSANSAARRLRDMGYDAVVRYAMRADGRNDWLVEAF